VRMHDGRVCGYGATQDIVGIGEVNDDDLVLLVDFFTDTDKVVRLESECLKGKAGRRAEHVNIVSYASK